MRTYSRGTCAGLSVSLALTAMSYAGLPEYTVQDLGTLGGVNSRAGGLNDLGQVSGWSHTTPGGDDRAFYWSPETGMLNLGTLGGTRSLAYAINNAGHVVGQAKLPSGYWRAFDWSLSSGMSDLGTPATTVNSVARGLNQAGQIAGFAYDGSGKASAQTRTGGSWQTLPAPSANYSQAQSVNDAGQIVGDVELLGSSRRNAALWNSGQLTDLGRLPARNLATGLDINNFAQIVGWSGNTWDVDGHAFYWSSGVMTDLGTLGGSASRANAINSAGLATGGAHTGTGDWHGFLFAEGALHDLNDLLAPGANCEVIEGMDINAAGQIVGNGLINGQLHAVLLTPVPEPHAFALMLGGCLAVLRRRGRR